MKALYRIFTMLRVCQALAAACLTALVPMATAQDESENEIYELSPFSVQAGDSDGYVATSTLAGTRIKTDVRDVGSAISILTKEIFDDTGATDAATILSYAANTEVGGPQGNFGNPSFTGDRPNGFRQQRNPQNSQRVRGLSEATLTRGYFLTDIAFDDYNTDRVTINRGPNSLLFGIGTPGGIINNSLKMASLGANFGEFSVRLGERGSYRGSVDLNRVLVKDRLALRVALLREDTDYQQRPANEIDQRIYATFDAVLFKNESSEFLGKTVFRGNYETGSIEGNPPSVLPPVDGGISDWFSLPDRSTYEAITGTTLPAFFDDGSWSPKITADTSRGYNWADFPASVGAAVTIQFPVIYQTPSSQTASAGLPSDPGIVGAMGRVNFDPEVNQGRVRFDTIVTRPVEVGGWLPGFRVSTINDPQVLDNRNLNLFGDLNFVKQDFDAQNFALEQSFFDGKAGIEFAYDKQNYDNFSRLPFDQAVGSNNSALDVFVDLNSHLSNGEPNPNQGKAGVRNRGTPRRNSRIDREAKRITGFVETDFTGRDNWSKWLGRHVFTGLWNEQEIDRETRNNQYTWGDASPATDVFDILFSNKSQGRIIPPAIYYLTDSLLDSSIQSFSDIRFDEYITAPYPKTGDIYKASYNIPRSPITTESGTQGFVDEFIIEDTLWDGSRSFQSIESRALSWQSYFFNGNVVALAGWRKDKATSFERVANVRDPITNEFLPASLELQNVGEDREGNTTTKSIVAHLPFQLPGRTDVSFHFSESENFSPGPVRRDALNDILPDPTGTTKEYGVTFEFLDRKLSARLNWFETISDFSTAQVGGTTGGANYFVNTYGGFWHRDAFLSGFPIEDATDQFSSYQEVLEAIESIYPPDLWEAYNLQLSDAGFTVDGIDNLAATESFISEGVELEIAGALSNNWNVFLNISKQEAVKSNIADAAFELAQILSAGAQAANLWELSQSPSVGDTRSWGDSFTSGTLIPLAGAKSRENTVSLEQRKWRANMITTYNFSEGRFKGIGVGGSLRWQDAPATGYRLSINSDGLQVPDLDNPFYGPEEFNGDIWVNYVRPLRDGAVDWKIQLNVRNLIGDQDMVPVATNPDGIVAITRNPNPREIFLTNTFSF